MYSSLLDRAVPELVMSADAAAAIVVRQGTERVDPLQRSGRGSIERRNSAGFENAHVGRLTVARDVECDGDGRVHSGVGIHFIFEPVLGKDLRNLLHIIGVAAAKIPTPAGDRNCSLA